MRNRIVTGLVGGLLGVILTGGVVAVAQQHQESAAKDAVQATMDKMRTSLFGEDVEAWAASFMDPLTMVFSDPRTEQGLTAQFNGKALRRYVRGEMRRFTPARFGKGDVKGLKTEIELLSLSVAVVSATFEPQSPEEEKLPRRGYTILLRKGTEWRITAILGGDAPSLQ